MMTRVSFVGDQIAEPEYVIGQVRIEFDAGAGVAEIPVVGAPGLVADEPQLQGLLRRQWKALTSPAAKLLDNLAKQMLQPFGGNLRLLAIGRGTLMQRAARRQQVLERLSSLLEDWIFHPFGCQVE